MNLLEIVKLKRQQLGLTQSQLSQVSGVSLPMIQNIEYGKANPSLGILEKLGNVLGFEIKLIQSEINWPMLAKAGAPIQEKEAYPYQIEKFALVSEIHNAWNQSISTRERESISALISAINRHFPSIWEKHLANIDFQNFEGFDMNRHLKLSRIAISKICQHL